MNQAEADFITGGKDLFNLNGYETQEVLFRLHQSIHDSYCGWNRFYKFSNDAFEKTILNTKNREFFMICGKEVLVGKVKEISHKHIGNTDVTWYNIVTSDGLRPPCNPTYWMPKPELPQCVAEYVEEGK